MAGIFDFLGGGPAPTPGLLDAAGYMDPAQYDAARRSQGMMGLWAGLLQGGGPSLEPRNFGSALGAGLVGQQKFGSTFDESQLNAGQAAQARANVGKLGAESENLRASTKMLADAAAMGIGMQAPGAAGAGGIGAVPNFGATPAGGDPRGVEPYIRERAVAYGIDPDVAVAVARTEGLSTFRSQVRQKDGSLEPSFGAFQLYTGGGLGNNFQKDTGLDPSDPKNERATIDYALRHASLRGWGPWHGAKNAGIGEWTGIGPGGTKPGTQVAAAGAGGSAPAGAPAPSGAIPEVPSYAGAFGGPAPAAVAGGPAAPAPGPLAGAPSGNRPGTNLPATGAGLVTPQDYARWLATQQPPSGNSGSGGPPMLPPDADYGGGGDAGEGGPTYGSGVLRGPVPAAAVAPAPPVPAPPPPVAPAPAPAALAPAAAAAALPAPPVPAAALPPPPRPELPARQPLPAQPALPAAPAPPPMPGAVAVPPLPAAQAPPAQGAQPYSPQAHKAQMIATALSMAGRTVPAFIAEAAGLPLAGQKAALEAAARQPFTLQGQQYGHALSMAKADWEARNKTQQDQYARQLDMTRDEFGASIKAQETDYNNGVEFAKKEWDAANDDRKAEIAFRNNATIEEYKEKLKIGSAGPIEQAKSGAQADNTQTTMVIGNREVPMTVGQANRISRGEPPEQVLGPAVLQLGKSANTGPIPEGYQMLPGVDGGGPRLVPLPGSPQALAQERKEASQQQNASVVTQDLRRVQDLVSGGFVTGLYGRGSQYLPGTDRTRFNALVSGIGANFSIDRLQQMRDSSPTGGAVGQVTQGEHKLLADSFGSLDPEQGEKQLSENIARVHQRYMDAINGSPAQLAKLLREGRITQGQHDTAIAQRDIPGGGGQAGTAPIDKAAFDRLPSGSVFTAPDGSRRIKP